MRILFVIGSLREGGAEGQVLMLMRGLRERGHDVALMLLHPEGMRLGEARRDGLRILPVGLPKFRPRWSPLPWLRLVPVYLRSRAMLREFRPDAVHAWLFWAHLWAWMVLAGDRRTPLVVSRRQMGSDKRGSRLLQWLENRVNRRACLALANAAAVAAECLRRERHLAGKLRVIPNGVDLAPIDAAHPADLRAEFPAFAGATHIAVTVANLLPHKGYPVLLRAWKAVAEQLPGARLLCIGSLDDAASAARIRAEAERLGIAGAVHFAGTRRDVPSLLKGADLALHASLDEGFSNAVLEYMACARAIVAADSGGNAEAIEHGRHGIIVPRGDAESLAREALRLLADPAERHRLGTVARARAEERYSPAAMVAATEALLREAAARRRS